jgi:3-isopropylmalate/(R)-2-methylmalate dehydratase small subunit
VKKFGGPVLFLDRSDINTDEIIPAKYLNENSREALKPYLLEDLKLAGFDPKKDTAGKGALVSRANFGCGSSREHAPWALEANGINIVIAESFARIFRQNMYNCGLVACELPAAVLDEIFAEFAKFAESGGSGFGGQNGSAESGGSFSAELEADIENGILVFSGGGKKKNVPFTLGKFEKDLVKAGGWVQYAASRY